MTDEFAIPFTGYDATMEAMGWSDITEWADDLLNDPYNSTLREFIYGTDQPVSIDWPDDDEDNESCEDCRRFVFDPDKCAQFFKKRSEKRVHA